jgi:hypothetical protein
VLDPDQAFLGCLLHCNHRAARRLLAGMRPDDVADPMARLVLATVIGLVVWDVAPAPAVVLAHARGCGDLPTEHKQRELGWWLITAYQQAPPPEAGDYLKAAVLEGALRRHLRGWAEQLAAVAGRASLPDLLSLYRDDDRLHDLWTRHHAASPNWAEVITPADREPELSADLSARSDCLVRPRPTPTPGDGGQPASAAGTRSTRRTANHRETAA